jgi:hypothetical protein
MAISCSHWPRDSSLYHPRIIWQTTGLNHSRLSISFPGRTMRSKS